MGIEARLYVTIREAVGHEAETFIQLAQRIHEKGPAQFTYNRLGAKQVMQARSIVPYVSFLYFLGILQTNDRNNYVCILTSRPTQEGAEELIKRKSLTKLEEAGFTEAKYKAAVKKMLRQDSVVLPTQKDVYRFLGLTIEEKDFYQMINLGSVREHYGYSLVTRRVMLPA